MIDFSKLLFKLGFDQDGKVRWESSLEPAELHLILHRVMLEISTGKVKKAEPEPSLVKPDGRGSRVHIP